LRVGASAVLPVGFHCKLVELGGTELAGGAQATKP
jgi:hypothetical protein